MSLEILTGGSRCVVMVGEVVCSLLTRCDVQQVVDCRTEEMVLACSNDVSTATTLVLRRHQTWYLS